MMQQMQNKKISELSSRVESNAIQMIKVVDSLYDQIDSLNRKNDIQEKEILHLKAESLRNSSIINSCTEMLNVLSDEIKILKLKTKMSQNHDHSHDRNHDRVEDFTEEEKLTMSEMKKKLEIFKTKRGLASKI